MPDFWNKLSSACEMNNKTPHQVIKEIGLTSATVAKYRKGVIPSGETLQKLADHLGVSADYLICDTDIPNTLVKKPSNNTIDFLEFIRSLPQRWASIRHGKPIDFDTLNNIALFTRSSPLFLISSTYTQYTPDPAISLFDVMKNINVLDNILGIMDRAPDSGDLKDLQINLSHIALYRIKENESIDDNGLLLRISDPKFDSLSKDKIKFLLNKNDNSVNATFKYGLNFTDLDVLREGFDVSFYTIFAGKEVEDIVYNAYTYSSEIEVLRNEVAKSRAK